MLDLSGQSVFTAVMSVLKAGNEFAAYLFYTVSDVESGSFDSAAFQNPSGRNNQVLSHFSVYWSSDTAPIPLPDAALLIPTGVADVCSCGSRARVA